jgi:hypothetical protein
MKVKYGFKTADNWYAFVSDSSDFRPIVEKLMKSVDHVSYTCDYRIIDDESGDQTITIQFNTDSCSWLCSIDLIRQTLLEIDGKLHVLPSWSFNDRFEVV